MKDENLGNATVIRATVTEESMPWVKSQNAVGKPTVLTARQAPHKMARQDSMKTKLPIGFWFLTFSGLAMLASQADAWEQPALEPELNFARDVLPILSNHCWSCHGPDEASRQAELRLDIRDQALQPHDGGVPIVPRQPQASEVIRRIQATDEDVVMPPPDALKPLSETQKAILERWIARGAEYTQHWAFRPPQRPTLPEVRETNWPNNTIDRFVLARLDAVGLLPARRASRETWLRRVTLDLTGLPPTLEELNAFLADPTPGAEHRVVDQLLNSTAHAERMAMHWLDAARYADTNGYNNDETRTMWPWRDWVIQAFQNALPYDQFLIEQLAGDLLPHPTLSQRVATGFNRNHVLTTEGGIIPEEYQAEYVADRVHTAATVFMGISLQCSRCHDHKFDPFTQRDFYRFAALFNNIQDTLGTYNTARMADPVLKVPSSEQQRILTQLKTDQNNLTEALQKHTANIDDRLALWEATLTPAARKKLASLGIQAEFRFDEADGETVANTFQFAPHGMIHGPALRAAGLSGRALQFTGTTHVDAGQVGNFDSDESFSLAAWFRPAKSSAGAICSKMDDANAYRGYDLLVVNGKVECPFVHHWPDKAFKVITKQPISSKEWHHVVVTYDGTRQADGVRLFVDGDLQAVEVPTRHRLDGPLTTDKPFHIGRRHASVPFHGLIDHVQVFSLKLSASEVAELAQGKAPERLDQILAVPPPDRSPSQATQLKQFYIDHVDTDVRRIREKLKAIPSQLEALEQAIPVTMVMQEMPTRRPTHILLRGQYDQLGEEVLPGLPVALVKAPWTTEATRLDLAHWLTHPDHPLTARVAVNRWWEMLFGIGLVETAEDFGVQGAHPSHPQLLDWLATELIQQQWNQRALLKMIVLSSTYRQSADVSPQQRAADPQNRLLSRGPQGRLPAEMIRDNALAISGLLQQRVGGPSVRPYQPAGLWEDVSVERRDKYVADTGPGLYRRSMYTFWKRTCPPPSMAAFDAPDRETCTIRRARTNTPLQALVLLNDPTYVEAARALAERIVQQESDDLRRIDYAFRCVLARRPRAAERNVLSALLTDAQKRFVDQPKAAQQLISVGNSNITSPISTAELAAWTSIASILLNLNETISKP